MTKLLKSDKYKKSRGGHSRLFRVFCACCDAEICVYQKDGPGILKRMYLDRILQSSIPIDDARFECTCGELLGTGMIYKKEQRPAIRLFVGAVRKELVSQADVMNKSL